MVLYIRNICNEVLKKCLKIELDCQENIPKIEC